MEWGDHAWDGNTRMGVDTLYGTRRPQLGHPGQGGGTLDGMRAVWTGWGEPGEYGGAPDVQGAWDAAGPTGAPWAAGPPHGRRRSGCGARVSRRRDQCGAVRAWRGGASPCPAPGVGLHPGSSPPRRPAHSRPSGRWRRRRRRGPAGPGRDPTMPQLEPTGGDDLGAPDELIAFQDEGEEQDKGAGRGSAHGDLDELKSSLVSETENRGGPGPVVGPGPEVRRGAAGSRGEAPPARPRSAHRLSPQAERPPPPRESFQKPRDSLAEGTEPHFPAPPCSPPHPPGPADTSQLSLFPPPAAGGTPCVSPRLPSLCPPVLPTLSPHSGVLTPMCVPPVS